MNLLILHISDLHFTPESDILVSRVPQIVGAVTSQLFGCSRVLIAVTGDLVDKGNYQSISSVHKFLNDLSEGIENIKPGLKVTLHFAPGNHDLELLPEDKGRTQIVRGIREDYTLLDQPDSTILRPCLLAQDKFFDFLRIRGLDVEQNEDRKLFFTEKLDFDSHTILVQSINSSWLSTAQEKKGDLVALTPKHSELESAILTVSLMHHPTSWLHTENCHEVRNFLDKTTDILLTGHEHKGTSHKEVSMEDLVTVNIEGCPLDHRENNSGFNIVNLDLKERSYKVSIFRWSNDRFDVSTTTQWQQISQEGARQSHGLILRPFFTNFLKDPGANHLHRAKEHLLLQDVYVYPDFLDFSYRVKKQNRASVEIKGESILEQIRQSKKIVISGGQLYGKTALAKNLFSSLTNAQFVPIWIDLPRKFNPKPTLVNELFFQTVEKLYGPGADVTVGQLPLEKRVVIIDDIHKANLSKNQISALLTSLEELADIIILTTTPFFMVQQSFADGHEADSHESMYPNTASSVLSYRHFEIRRFGRLLRSKLVKKWMQVGQDVDDDPRKFEQLCVETERLLDTLLRKSIVPSVPFYILSLIQAREANQPLSTETGSFGYHYEFLIGGAISQAVRHLGRTSKSITGEMIHTFLALLAFESFERRDRHYTVIELETHVSDYRSKYQLTFSINDFISVLTEARMLTQGASGKYTFAYPYIYYFFVGKFFQTNINSKSYRSRLRLHASDITSKLHLDEHANIALFLIYLTKDEDTINQIISNAKSLLFKQLPTDLESDIKWMKSGSIDIRQFPDNSQGPQKNRERVLELLDKQSDGEDTLDGSAADQESSPEDDSGWIPSGVPDEIRELYLALRHIQITGQILRSFPGTIPGELKEEIAEQCSLLAFRLLGRVLSMMRVGRDDFAKVVIKDIRNQGVPITEDEIRKTVDDLLTQLALLTIFGVLSSTSLAMGSAYLSRTFDLVMTPNSTKAFQLLRIKLRLDHESAFPLEQVLALRKELENAKKMDVPMAVLRLMVEENLYLYPVQQQDREKIISRFGLDKARQSALAEEKRL